MSKIYIDCTNGISSDMVLMALKQLGAIALVKNKVDYHFHDDEHDHHGHHHHGHDHDHDHAHEHHHDHDHDHHDHDHGHGQATYGAIAHIIDVSELDMAVKAQAKAIYRVIARAEGEVHGAPMEEVHFHEVGREQAVMQITGIAQALDDLEVTEVYCSPVHDGHGEIECAHGIIPVPVPAVKAMMKECDFTFVTDDVDTEMVTPSGLGALIGMGAVCVEDMPEEFKAAQAAGTLREGVGVGTRDIGRDGLKIYLLED